MKLSLVELEKPTRNMEESSLALANDESTPLDGKPESIVGREPVRQVFVDDVGYRRRFVLTAMTVSKMAVVLFAALVAVGLYRTLSWQSTAVPRLDGGPSEDSPPSLTAEAITRAASLTDENELVLPAVGRTSVRETTTVAVTTPSSEEPAGADRTDANRSIEGGIEVAPSGGATSANPDADSAPGPASTEGRTENTQAEEELEAPEQEPTSAPEVDEPSGTALEPVASVAGTSDDSDEDGTDDAEGEDESGSAGEVSESASESADDEVDADSGPPPSSDADRPGRGRGRGRPDDAGKGRDDSRRGGPKRTAVPVAESGS